LREVCFIDKETLSSKTPDDYRFEYVSLSDIEKGNLIQVRKYKFSEAPSRARRIVKQDDVLLATVRPNLQGFYIFRNEVKDCIVSTGFAVLTAKRSWLEPAYLFQMLFSNQMLAIYHAFNVGSNYPAINSSDIHKFKVCIPSLAQQKAIASLLATWDTAIEKTEALIAAKEKRFKWLLKTLICDQQDNPEWRKVKLGEIFGEQILVEKGRVLTKKQMSNGSYPVVAGGQSYATFHNRFTHDAKTITISSSGAYAGFVWFHDYPIFATDCNVITAIGSKSIIEYFYYAIKIQQNRLYGLQSGGAQPHIYAKDIATLEILIPTVTRQRKVAHILDKTRKEIDSLKGLVKLYQIQKRGLMQKLLTGKWKTQPAIPAKAGIQHNKRALRAPSRE